jgi:molybdate transport system substrate-binding protein
MRRSALTAVTTAGLLLAACSSSSTPAASPSKSSATSSAKSSASSAKSSASGSSSPALSGTVNVFAAASLKESFTKLGQQFEAAHPGVKVVFNFGPSSGLATQIRQGAPADVFASASTKNMDQVRTTGAATAATNFASNVMEIAVPAKNPAKVTGLSDLARSGLKLALCQRAVPCGATAAKVFSNAKITVSSVTQEVDVKAVLTKVTLGEVDAGVVYVTDVRAAGAKVKGIVIPANVNASTQYPIATLTKAPNKATAQAFTDYVLSTKGAAVLAAAGFAKP